MKYPEFDAQKMLEMSTAEPVPVQEPPKRKRGRPKGSKNKPKPVVVPVEPTGK